MKRIAGGHVYRSLLAGLCLLLPLLSHAETPTHADTGARGGAAVDHIDVTGTDVVEVKPDMAVLTFTVAKDGKTAADAKRQVDAVAAHVLAKLKKYSSKDLKIIANNLSINKTRNYKTGEIISYNVSMPFEIELYNLDLQNHLLDDMLGTGVDDLNPLAYKFRDENAAYDRAMLAALRAAKSRAEKIAAFYGRRLGPVRQVEDASFASRSPLPIRPMMNVKMMAAAEPAQTQVMVPDHIDYSFTVYVTYALE